MAKDIKKKEEKQEILEPANAGKARLIAAVMVIIAVFFGTRSSLMSMRNEALEYFTNGDPSKSLDYGIVYDLNNRITDAKGIANSASHLELTFGADIDVFIKNIETDCSNMEKVTEPNKLYKYNEELEKDVCALIEYFVVLENSGMIINSKTNASIADAISSTFEDFEAANQIIGHSVYNEKAKEFNEILSAFPTNITSKLAFVKPLSLFAY